MTKEEMIAAIKECAAKLGHTPSLPELREALKISRRQVQRHFGSYKKALQACGMERRGTGYRLSLEALFLEWAGLVRKLGKVPTITEFEMLSRYSWRPMVTRFGKWTRVARGMRHYIEREGLQAEWQDVLDVIDQTWREKAGLKRPSSSPSSSPAGAEVLPNRTIYGTPLLCSPMTCAPTNEFGVLFLFGAYARELGFAVNHIQQGFPDGEALREIAPGRWQRIRIEFEYESRNFRVHGHDPEKCDVIVCWIHNWEECPIEVIELSKIVGKRS